MECWDGTWDDCQVAEEGKACSLEMTRMSLVRKLEAVEEGLVTRVRTTSISLESETYRCNKEGPDMEDEHLQELIIHGDDIFRMESVERSSTMSSIHLSALMSTSGEGDTNPIQGNADTCADYSLPTILKTSTEIQLDQDKKCFGASASIKAIASLPPVFILSSGSLELGVQTDEFNKQKSAGEKIQRGYKQTKTLEQGKSMILGNKQGRSLEEGDACLKSMGNKKVAQLESNSKARKRHSSQPVSIPQAAYKIHTFTNTSVTHLAIDSLEGKDVGLSIAHIAKQMADKTCGSLPVHPKPPRSRDVSKTFDGNENPEDSSYPQMFESGTMEFYLPFDSDDEDIDLIDICTDAFEDENPNEIIPKVLSTEVEIEALIDQVALLNTEGKCRA